ncbi:unnamed protein product [Hanseniaspora opuntiae]
MKANNNIPTTNGRDDINKINYIHIISDNSPGHCIAKSFESYFPENQVGHLASCETVDGSKKSPSIKEEEEVNNSSNIQEIQANPRESNTQKEPYIPVYIRYLKKKGYNLEKDILGIKLNPDSAQKIVEDFAKTIEHEVTRLINISEANWDKNAPIIAKMIREESQDEIFNGTGLDFILIKVIFKLLPGDKGSDFKTRMEESDLETILSDLEMVVDEESHPLYVANQFFDLAATGHDCEQQAVATVSKFVDLLRSYKTAEEQTIFLLQATCKTDGGLPEDWYKETSLSQYLYKVNLRKRDLRVRRELMNRNNINSKKISKGRVYKPGRKRKHKKNFRG